MTTTLAPTETYTSFERALRRKNPLDASVLETQFAQLDSAEQFDALVLAFDTLVINLRTDGKTAWSDALLAALDKMAIRFLSTGAPADEDQYRKGTCIEDAVFAGLRGRKHARRVVPYDAEELLSVLLAAVIKGHPDLTLATSRHYATEAFGPDFSGFRSAFAQPAPHITTSVAGAFSWN